MAFPTKPCFWDNLPTEVKFAVVDNLDLNDARALSRVDQRTYRICISTTFKTIKLDHLGQLQRFLDNVPRDYCQYIRHLDLSTQPEPSTYQRLTSYHAPRAQTDAVVSLLLSTPRLAELVLRMAGSSDKSLIVPFGYLFDLRRLSIVNCSQEDVYPLSERLVVSIAATVPRLEQLSLDKISRSKLHAPELEGVFPSVPLVIGDDDIPDHPQLGSQLCLPSLLRVPTLRKLVIRDTHLGDPRWVTTPVACRLEVLDLGSCYHENEDFNRICTERIMAAVGPTVNEFSLTTSVSDAVFSKPSVTPLPRLRKLHISPFFPVDSVVDTMSNLAGSPIESLSMQCYEDDVIDVCSALEDFLSLRVERGPEFYRELRRIDVSVAVMDYYSGEGKKKRMEAMERLQEFCRDLQLASVVGKASEDPAFLPCEPLVGRPSAAVTMEDLVMINERMNLLKAN